MKEVKFLITVQNKDGTTEDYILFEPIAVGLSYKGGKVISCHQLKKKYSCTSVQ